MFSQAAVGTDAAFNLSLDTLLAQLNDKIANMRLIARSYFALLKAESLSWSQEKVRQKDTFLSSLTRLYDQLQRVQQIKQEAMSVHEQKAVVISAIKVAESTKVFLDALSAVTPSGLAPQTETNQQAKAVIVRSYHHQFADEEKSSVFARHFGQAVFTVCSAVIGFLFGAAIGAMLSLAGAVTLPALGAGVVVGGVAGAVYAVKTTEQPAFLKRAPIESLEAKAAKVARHGATLFSASTAETRAVATKNDLPKSKVSK